MAGDSTDEEADIPGVDGRSTRDGRAGTESDREPVTDQPEDAPGIDGRSNTRSERERSDDR